MSATRTSEMVTMFRSGKTYQEIADHYGLSRERVRQILARADVSAREGGRAQRVSARRDEGVKLYVGGLTMREAAERVGVGRHGLALEIDRRGLRRPYLREQHGTQSSYAAGCRCPRCTKANTDYRRARRQLAA